MANVDNFVKKESLWRKNTVLTNAVFQAQEGLLKILDFEIKEFKAYANFLKP